MSESTANLLTRENLPEFEIKIPERINKLHPLLATAKKTLVSSYEHNGLATAGRQNLHLHVSKANIDRAIKILSTLLSAFEKRSFTFTMQNKHGNFIHLPTVNIQGIEIRFKLQERTKRTVVRTLEDIKQPSLKKQMTYSFKSGESYLMPTGQLYLEIESDYSDLRGRKLWEDNDKTKIEDQLNSFMEGLIITSEGLRLKEERWAEDRRQWDSERAIVQKREDQIKAKQNRIDNVKALADKTAEFDKVLALKNKLHCPDSFLGLEKEVAQFSLWIDEYLENGDPVSQFLKNTVKPLIDTTA